MLKNKSKSSILTCNNKSKSSLQVDLKSKKGRSKKSVRITPMVTEVQSRQLGEHQSSTLPVTICKQKYEKGSTCLGEKSWQMGEKMSMVLKENQNVNNHADN